MFSFDFSTATSKPPIPETVIGKLYKAFDVPVYATLKGVSILLMIWLVDYCLTSQVIYGKRNLLITSHVKEVSSSTNKKNWLKWSR